MRIKTLGHIPIPDFSTIRCGTEFLIQGSVYRRNIRVNQRNPLRLCIDMQPAFLAAIPESQRVHWRCSFALEAAVGFGLPVLFPRLYEAGEEVWLGQACRPRFRTLGFGALLWRRAHGEAGKPDVTCYRAARRGRLALPVLSPFSIQSAKAKGPGFKLPVPDLSSSA